MTTATILLSIAVTWLAVWCSRMHYRIKLHEDVIRELVRQHGQRRGDSQ